LVNHLVGLGIECQGQRCIVENQRPPTLIY